MIDVSIITNIIGLHWLIINAIIFALVYQCILRYWSYFSKNNVKFVRGVPILGVHYRTLMGKEVLGKSHVNVYNAYPNERVIGTYEMGGVPSYIIRDPELIKQMAIKDFDHFTNHQFHIKETSDPIFSRSLFFMRDQRWKDMRSTLSPAFTGSKMKLMFSLMVENCQSFCDSLKDELGNGAKVYDFNDLAERFANDVIANCAFGIKIDSMKDKSNDFLKAGFVLSRFSGMKGIKFLGYGAMPKVMNLLKAKVLEESEVNFFRKILMENMAYREENNVIRNDMVNLLLEAKKGNLNEIGEEKDSDIGFATLEESSLGPNVRKIQKWTEDDLVAQTIIFFIAGFGTVSKTLSFAVHELTVNPDIQKKLYDEVKHTQEMLNGTPLTYGALQNMKYVDMIMSETLRRWPQVPASDRQVNKPYLIEDYNGLKIQLNVGDSIQIPTQALLMDPKYYPNPEKFNPERFNDENKNTIVSGTYLPFGVGPRSCIGTRFALMECKAFLYYLVLNFHLEKCEKTQDPLRLKLGPSTPDAENGFWIQFRQRK